MKPFFLGLIPLFWSFAAQSSPIDCTGLNHILASQGETSLDAPWAEAARQLQSRARRGEALSPWLAACLPNLVHSLQKDGAGPWLNLWGQSLNFDEHAQGIIVAMPLLSELAKLVGQPGLAHQKTLAPDKPIGHAGLTHTYGYLFSTLPTPFGFKRARWVGGELEGGFGLPEKLLGPTPSEGTFLANVTYFLGRIAFARETSETSFLHSADASVAPALRHFDFSHLKGVRLTETAMVASATIEVRTDLVAFSHTPRVGTDAYLLVYSVKDGRTGAARLITGFPIASDFAQSLQSPSSLGAHQPIATHYNGYVPGLTENGGNGSRRLSALMVSP